LVLLRAINLTKKYGDFVAVDGVNFSIEEGEIFGLLGPNGAGKTSIINMLTGLASITSGSVNIGGFEYTHTVKEAQGMMGIVPDESNLYDELSGLENLCFCAALYGIEKEKRERRARELLELFGLVDAGDKPFKAYSKGMKRKLTIAAGIVHKPKILFLDEPTTGIDVVSARHIRKMLLQLNKRGTTIFLTTHYIEEAERLCHRIAFIVKGKIIRTGTVRELLEEAQNDNIVQFSLADSALELRERLIKEFPGVSAEFVNDTTVRIRSAEHIALMPFVKFFDQHGLVVYEAKIVRPSLEEVFVKVTGIELEEMKKEKEGRRR